MILKINRKKALQNVTTFLQNVTKKDSVLLVFVISVFYRKAMLASCAPSMATAHEASIAFL